MTMIQRTSFSSLDLPPNLNDKERFDHWLDLVSRLGPAEYKASGEVPFAAHNALYQVGDVVVGMASGSITEAARTRQHVSTSAKSCYFLHINSGENRIHGEQGGREFSVGAGGAVLLSDAAPFHMSGGVQNRWKAIFLPHATLERGFRSVEDGIANVVAEDSETLGLIRQTSRFMASAELNSLSMVEHAANTLTDLVGLAAGLMPRDFGADGPRGLRAARLIAIEQRIASQFDDPHISAPRVALQLGLSARYLYDLLQDTGIGFSDRVMELRLQKTRAMLTSANCRHMRISEIALTCGFSDISHFNRCFRRRFGCTPTAAR